MKKNTLRRAGALLLALALIVSLVTLPASAAPADTVAVTVKPNTLTLALEERVQLDVTVTVNGVVDPNAVVTLSCTPEKLVRTNSKLEVVGNKVGTGTVTATYNHTDGKSYTATCAVEVVAPVSVTDVYLDESSLSILAGESATLTANIVPEDATNKKLIWVSSDDDVATVDENGRVTGVAKGEAVITVTSADGGKTDTCAVTVSEPIALSGLKITSDTSTVYMDVGRRLPLTARLDPANATERNVVWTSSDTGIATVAGNTSDPTTANVTGVSIGTATITARIGSHTATFDVQVSGLILDETELELQMGRTASLVATPFGAAQDRDIEWESSMPTVASVTGTGVSGKVAGHNPGYATITADAGGYTAECSVEVEEDIADAILTSVDAGMPLELSGLISQMQSRCQDKTGGSLRSVTIQAPTSQGILFYGYSSPDAPGSGVGKETYYVNPTNSQRGLADITFVPNSSFTGTAIISYNGQSEGGQSFNGTIRVEVKSTGDVAYSTASGRPVQFSAADFTAICKAKTGKEINYLTFEQPSASQGALYYNYSNIGQFSPQVSESGKYYRNNNPYIDNISFVPEEDYTGTVEISYRCYMVGGGSRTGTVTIVVYAPDGANENKVTYSVPAGGHVTLEASDFNAVSRAATGETLRYVYFDLPLSDEGTLYYNYRSSTNYGSQVSGTTRYFRSSTPRIDNVTFVAAKDFTGTVTIPFTGYDTDDGKFEGELVIKVGGADGTVRYTTGVGQPVEFDGLDFNEACQSANSASLDWISFELPTSSVGTLYRNYRSGSSPGTKITASTELSRSELSNVTFVPKSSLTGTTSIYFSGYDSVGGRFSGAVEITIDGSASDEIVRYATVTEGLIEFSADDFNDACQAITGDNLSYVRFTLPAASYGKLYYQYNTDRETGASVSSSTSYYRSGGARLLDDVSFLADDRTGTLEIEYTGRSTGGDSFDGIVQITIGTPQSSAIRYTGSSAPIALRQTDFQEACAAALGGTLSYIRFSYLPSASAGRLYTNYSTPNRPGTAVTAETSYDFSSPITFLPKAEYQGQVSIPYTAWDTRGRSHSGTVTIQLSNAYCYTSFTDLSGYDWAKPSIEFLRQAGITNGYGANRFGPGRQISRGEFALMICRAFGFNTAGSASSFSDVPANSVYAGAVATAKELGIVQGSNGRFMPASPITRQSAMTMICRAMTAAGKTVPYASTGILSNYADGASVNTHARPSVAALIQMGAVRGNASMQLKPTAAISRAEMAVILHRVLTS